MHDAGANTLVSLGQAARVAAIVMLLAPPMARANEAKPALAVPDVPKKVSSNDEDACIPSLGTDALLAELQANALRLAAVKDERARLEAERVKIEALRAELMALKASLVTESDRLEKAQAAAAHAMPNTGRSTAKHEAASGVPGPSSPERRQVERESLAKVAQAMKGMKRDKVAGVLEKLDRGLATELLGQMRASDAAAVLDLLKPETAAELTTRLAMARAKDEP